MSTFARILAELSDPTSQTVTESDGVATYNEHNVFQLASLADCGSPDAIDSPGAAFLARVARDVAERVDTDDPASSVDSLREDAAHEIADSAVPVYTHERWQTFTDLAAYNEDVSDLTSDVSDLTATAGVALYMIAERLVLALADELSDALDELDEDAPDYTDPDTEWPEDGWREATDDEARAYHSGHWTPGLLMRESEHGVEVHDA